LGEQAQEIKAFDQSTYLFDRNTASVGQQPSPVEQFFLQILVAAVIVGVFSALYPAVRTAHADPAKVLQK
jgi:ABC-type lipoprotein release transport system permease subunit